MTFDAATRHALLRDVAHDYVDVAISNIEREYPHMPWLVVHEPGPLPGHRNLHPTFYGSFDWHSCVAMFWTTVKLLRDFPGDVPQGRARYIIDLHLSTRFLKVEETFLRDDRNRGFERPYGWGWLLTLQSELDDWDDPDARRWATNLRELSGIVVERFLEWLPLLTYPQRTGVHPNTAFGLLRSLNHAERLAERGEPALRTAIEEAARRFFQDDVDYPAHYEPSGADFLSAALIEAELMARIFDQDEFAAWFSRFLPAFDGENGASLFTPAIVTDPTDGQIGHLSGLNLSRAATLLAIAAALPEDDPRIPMLTSVAETHANASLGVVTGGDYATEHWLVAYATWLLAT